MPRGSNLAIDRKALRGSARIGQSPVHMVSAFAAGLGLALCQEKVADKSNEIIGILAMSQALTFQRCLLNIDAMGTQSEIARAIRRGLGSDYLLAVKANLSTLRESFEGAFVGHWDEVHNTVHGGRWRHVFQV